MGNPRQNSSRSNSRQGSRNGSRNNSRSFSRQFSNVKINYGSNVNSNNLPQKLAPLVNPEQISEAGADKILDNEIMKGLMPNSDIKKTINLYKNYSSDDQGPKRAPNENDSNGFLDQIGVVRQGTG